MINSDYRPVELGRAKPVIYTRLSHPERSGKGSEMQRIQGAKHRQPGRCAWKPTKAGAASPSPCDSMFFWCSCQNTAAKQLQAGPSFPGAAARASAGMAGVSHHLAPMQTPGPRTPAAAPRPQGCGDTQQLPSPRPHPAGGGDQAGPAASTAISTTAPCPGPGRVSLRFLCGSWCSTASLARLTMQIIQAFISIINAKLKHYC